jgi:hypothetical protein
MAIIFKIEKGFALPKIDLDFKLFPFEKMEVGDSFFVKNTDLSNYSAIQTSAYLRSQSKKFRRFTGKNYVFSIVVKRKESGVRVFRVY